MATEILVNDGGAPARILPFVAGEAITAGWPVQVKSDGKIEGTTTNFASVGFALNDAAAANDRVNVITGSGVILRAMCANGTTVGDMMSINNNQLEDNANGTGAADDDIVAVALEANASGGTALAKVLVI